MTAPAHAALAPLTTLIYELLDAHRDTVELADGLPDESWRAHVDYLRALQRTGRELLARANASADERGAAHTQPSTGGGR